MSELKNYSQNLAITLATMGFVINSSRKFISKLPKSPFAAVYKVLKEERHPSLKKIIMAEEKPEKLRLLRELQADIKLNLNKVYSVGTIETDDSEIPYDEVLVFIDGKQNTEAKYFIGYQRLYDNNPVTWEQAQHLLKRL